MERETRSGSYLIEMVSDIVSAYVAHNPVPVADLPRLIERVHATLTEIDSGGAVEAKQELKPAVSVRKSVTDEHIVCLEDGKKFKSLKRHLRTRYDMSPEEYREKWACRLTIRWWRRPMPSNAPISVRKMGLGQSKK